MRIKNANDVEQLVEFLSVGDPPGEVNDINTSSITLPTHQEILKVLLESHGGSLRGLTLYRE